MAGASSSSAEPAGFRVERRLGDDLWEATQVDLSRRVALRRLPPGTPFDAGAWPHRAGVVALFAVVEHDGATYLATRFVPGARTLAQVRGAAARRRALAEATATLADVLHGDLTERDVLVDADGHALVTGFGRAPAGASHGADLAALAAMGPPESRHRRRALPLLALAAAVAVVAAVLLRGDGPPGAAPAVTKGATAIGSALGSGPFRTRDCVGDTPSGGSPGCTILPTALPGRRLRVSERSLVRGWAVRGVTGRVRLAVIRREGAASTSTTAPRS